MHDSDSDFTEEYAPSQHADRSSRYTARMQKPLAGSAMKAAQSDALLPYASIRPRTASLHSSTNEPVVQYKTSGQACTALVASRCFRAPQRQHIGDARLDAIVHQKFAAATCEVGLFYLKHRSGGCAC